MAIHIIYDIIRANWQRFAKDVIRCLEGKETVKKKRERKKTSK